MSYVYVFLALVSVVFRGRQLFYLVRRLIRKFTR